MHIIDTMLSYEKTQLVEEEEETSLTEETMIVGNRVNTFSCVYVAEKKNVQEWPLIEDLNQNKNSQCKLRIEGLVHRTELIRKKLNEHLLRKITSLVNSTKNTQNKSQNTIITKNTSTKGKIKSILSISDNINHVDSLAMLIMIDFNILKHINKYHANISLFELSKIMTKQELLVRACEQYSSLK